MSESTADRNPFERLAEEFAERLRLGELPSITEYVNRYPEHADDIRELFPALALVELNKPAPEDHEISSPGPVPSTRGSAPEQLGDYRILRHLGEGGMGVVYEAVRESLRSHVALKVMHPQYRNREKYLRRFRTEARSAARLHHTNIVSVFDYGVHDGVCYYAMQYIAGQSLDKILADVRQIRRERAGFAAFETATRGCGDDDGAEVGHRDIHNGAGSSRTDPFRHTVTMGLLTGQYAAAARAEGSDDATTPPLPTGRTATEEAIGQSDKLNVWAEQLARQFGTTMGMGEDRTEIETPPGPLGSEPGRAQAVIAPAHDPAPDSGDARGSEHPAFSGSTSTLAGKSHGRYYREVARLGAQVADALAYAHQRGVLHRDIKPPNLILDPLGNIWITDFGLAKFEDGDDVSQSQDLVGTLRYMAPERFRGISTAQCDLYALGATLYEMLTLRPPFEGQDQLELIHRVENEPPVPPRQIDRAIPADIETIVLKALAKNPEDRFASAEKVAKELRLFLESRPLSIRPIPFYQRFWRWCQRNPKLAAANIAAAALTTMLAIVMTVAAWKLSRAQKETRMQLFEALYDRARFWRISRQMGQRFKSLEAIHQAADIGRELNLPPAKFDPLRDEAIACMALPDLKPTGRVMTRPPGMFMAAFDPTMTRYALRFRDGTISVRRVADDQEVARFSARGDRGIDVFRFSPDSRYLATTQQPGSALTVWDVDQDAVVLNDPGPTWGAVRFSPDNRRLALVHVSRELLVYDLTTRRISQRWNVPGLGNLAFRPDGAQIAVTDNEANPPTCRILDGETGRFVQTVALRTPAEDLAWSPDGTTLATPGSDRKIDLWDVATGIRRATLEGHTTGGIAVAFHPSGALLVSGAWEGRTRLWDPVLGRTWLTLPGGGWQEFNRDGRIVVDCEDTLTPYQVDPALEYRTFAHASIQRGGYYAPSIRHGGRVLAVGTNRGVMLWDLARGTEPAFLPVGLTWGIIFEASGDLLTSGAIGVRRWPIELDPDRGILRIGPPRQLPLPPGLGIAEDRSGRIVAQANYDFAFIATPERTTPVGPLDDCRFVTISPDGEWLVTGSHVASPGAQVWRIRDATKLAELPIDHTPVLFSPDGKWLMTRSAPCRLWEVGTWREARQIDGTGLCFSPDGRLVVVHYASMIIRLVETETGRTLARLESPDLCSVWGATFSPEGSRLVVTTNDGPAVHVWNLRAIRRQLARIGLDWDAPAYPDDDPASLTLPPLPPLRVDLGLSPLSWHPDPKFYEDLIADLEAALARQPDQRRIRGLLANSCNTFAWSLVSAPGSTHDQQRALSLARRAVELAPTRVIYLNTLGVAQYRAGQDAEAIVTLEKSLAAAKGESDAFDLFFLAMARYRLGRVAEARADFNRAIQWRRDHPNLTQPGWSEELDAFQAEAEAVLAGPGVELPEDVFAEP
jgi:serine/threonine protein kinase/WD40 repeat protein